MGDADKKPRFDWAAMTDDEYLKTAEMQLWLSAFASNNPRAPAHKHADDAYDEAQRRAKPWLYQRAWNASYRSAGYDPSERDIELARSPALQAAISTDPQPGTQDRNAGRSETQSGSSNEEVRG